MTLGIVEIIGQMIFIIVPPIFGGILAIIAFLLISKKLRYSGSIIGHLGMILILVLAQSIGGVFNILGAIVAILASAVFFLGAWKVIGQR